MSCYNCYKHINYHLKRNKYKQYLYGLKDDPLIGLVNIQDRAPVHKWAYKVK